VLGYHFSREDGRLRFPDGRVIRLGEKHTVPSIRRYRSGLYASKRLIDALGYAPGPILHRVKLSGKILHWDSESAAEERTYLKRYDLNELLRTFARRQALINSNKIKMYCGNYDLIAEWLATGDRSLMEAAWSIAWSTAMILRERDDATAEAAWSIAWSAVDSAVEAAVRAQRSASWSLHKSDTSIPWEGFETEANQMLMDLMCIAFPGE